MKHLMILGIAVVTLGLAACTGTTSPQAPRLLVVTHEGVTADAVSLVADSGPGETQRLEFLAETTVELPGSAVALDVVDRAGERDAVVILVERDSFQYSAVFIATAGIGIESTAGFTVTADLDLTALLDASGHDVNQLCLQAIQVTSTGEQLALLDVPEKCPGATQAPELFLVDVRTGAVESFAGSEDLLPVAPFLDQGLFSTQETLHFAVGVPGTAGVKRIGMEDLATSDGPNLPGLGSRIPIELGPVRGSLAALATDRLSHVPLTEGAATAGSFAVSSATRLIMDPYGNDLESVMVIEGSTLAVYPALSDTGRATAALGAGVSDAVIDGDRLWLYALRNAGITIVDMLEADSPSARRENLPELTSPGLITWIPGVLPPPDQP